MKHPVQILKNEYVDKGDFELTIDSATEFYICGDGQGNSFLLKFYTAGWVVQYQNSFLCKDKVFRHKDDLPEYIELYFPSRDGIGLSHVFASKEEALEAFRSKDFPNLPVTKDFYNEVYNILIQFGEAPNDESREAFIYNYTDDKIKDNEWRFKRFGGYGMWYCGEINEVNCFTVDKTPERIEMIKTINEKLKDLQNDSHN